MEHITLIKSLNEGKTRNEICNILGISNQQLYNNLIDLEQHNFFYKREYYSNGSITYKQLLEDNNQQKFIDNLYKCTNLITPPGSNSLKCMVISDLHFGNTEQRLDLLEKVFNYCIKSNIHIIFCCGDMIDGNFSRTEQSIEDSYDQIEYFIKNYPFDKSILTFAVAGNHDKCFCKLSNQDIITKIQIYRHDIVIGGYGNAHINIKNDQILLYHYIKGIKINVNNATVILKGHYHKYSTHLKDDSILYIKVPSLSNLTKSIPTVLELNLDFQKGIIEHVNIKQLYFINKLEILDEQEFCLNKKNMSTNMNILEETNDDKILVKKLGQIEKFNRKYGIK